MTLMSQYPSAQTPYTFAKLRRAAFRKALTNWPVLYYLVPAIYHWTEMWSWKYGLQNRAVCSRKKLDSTKNFHNETIYSAWLSWILQKDRFCYCLPSSGWERIAMSKVLVISQSDSVVVVLSMEYLLVYLHVWLYLCFVPHNKLNFYCDNILFLHPGRDLTCGAT